MRIGAANDPEEREAKRIADVVVNSTSGSLDLPAVEAKGAKLHAAPSVSTKPFQGPLGSTINAVRSRGGAPLPPDTRAFMETRFNTDLSVVRIHTDMHADRLSNALSANAFTVGKDVFFARGEFSPQSDTGRHLLAHEIAHVTRTSLEQHPVLRRSPKKQEAKASKTSSDLASEILKMAKTVDDAKSKLDRVANIMEPYWYLGDLGTPEMPSEWTSFRDDGDKLTPQETPELHAVHGAPIAKAFFDLIQYDDLGSILTHQVGIDIFWLMSRPLGAPDPRMQGLLAQYYGKLSEAALTSIEEQNYPSGTVGGTVPGRSIAVGNEYANWCMNAVLGNIESSSDSDIRAEILALAKSDRDKVVTELTKEFEALEKKAGNSDSKAEAALDRLGKRIDYEGKARNSQNLNAATTLGYAQHLGKCKPQFDVCRETVKHSEDSDFGVQDPFVLQGEDDLFRSFFEPAPQQLMLDAIAGADVGTYMFVASVAGHHSVTLLLQKLTPGRVKMGSGNYTITWNDQYTDGDKKWFDNPKFDPSMPVSPTNRKRVSFDIGDGEHGANEEQYDTRKKLRPPKGKLGKTLSDRELAKKIFYLGEEHGSNPNAASFWAGDTANHAAYTGRAKDADSGNTPIENTAESRRCRNVVGIELWHLTPFRR